MVMNPPKRKIQAKSLNLNTSLTVKSAIEEFNRYQAANARSAQTAKTYSSSLHVFSLFFEKAFGSLAMPMVSLTKGSLVEEYVMYLRTERGNSDVSVAFHKRHLRVFLYWCMDRSYLPEQQIVVKNPQEEVPEVYSEEEINKLIKKPKTEDFTENRNWVIINLMLATGNRRNTIANYKIGDVDFDDDYLIMNTTKSKKGQRIPISKKLRPVLKEYIATYRSDCKDDEPLFPSYLGEWISPNALSKSLAEYNTKRGVEKTGMHLFRHTFAKDWVRSGGDSLTLQRILGHSSLAMTEKYVRLFGEDISGFVDRYASLGKYKSENTTINTRTKIRKGGRH